MEDTKLNNKELWLNQAMVEFNKKFYRGVLNIVNAPAGCGKSTFIFNEFLNESYKYVDHLKKTKKYYYKMNLDKVLYVCDTNMLKSSILQENQGLTKMLGKNDLKEAMKTKTFDDILKGNVGYINVITYSTLGWLLQQDGSRYIILNYLDVILMDEMHNLFKYANRFDSENNKKLYGTVINYLPELINKTLVIALSATVGRIFNTVRELQINTNTIFKFEEREQIKQLNFNPMERNSIMNSVKIFSINKDKIKERNWKIFLYTNTIKQSEKYKQFFNNVGLKAEWLCSINNKETITTINDKGEETIEKVPKMNKYQLEIRDRLINGIKENEDLTKGTLPDDLDVLIVNGAYETGWNLKDEKIQIVLVDSTEEDVQIQARNRVRHDIKILDIKVRCTSDGEILEYGQYREDLYAGRGVSIPILASHIPEKYIGVKLSTEDKIYLVNNYAAQWYDYDSVNFKTFKRDLEKAELILETTHKGTYIYTKEQYEERQKVKHLKEVKKMNKINTKNKAEDIIKDYMNVKLFKDKQKELQNRLIDIKVKTNGDGTLGKKMVQNIIEGCGYIFISKPETKGEMRKKQYWYITNIEIA